MAPLFCFQTRHLREIVWQTSHLNLDNDQSLNWSQQKAEMRNFSVTSNFAFNRFRTRDLVQRSVRISLLLRYQNTHDIRTSICNKFRSRDSGAQVRRKILTLDSRITRFCSATAMVHTI
jgi:hypothetical protein